MPLYSPYIVLYVVDVKDQVLTYTPITESFLYYLFPQVEGPRTGVKTLMWIKTNKDGDEDYEGLDHCTCYSTNNSLYITLYHRLFSFHWSCTTHRPPTQLHRVFKYAHSAISLMHSPVVLFLTQPVEVQLCSKVLGGFVRNWKVRIQFMMATVDMLAYDLDDEFA